jgi:hypothetical protein
VQQSRLPQKPGKSLAAVLGKTPMQAFLDARTIAQEKQMGEQFTAQLEA